MVKRVTMASNATTVSIALADAEATRKLGAALAITSQPGAVILLQGPLGAGKTTLVDGFTQEMGGGRATSPTFVIAHEHSGGKIPIWHLDLYRMEDEREVAALDLAQYMSDSAITLCEWPERASGMWPGDAVTVKLAVEGVGRSATIAAGGIKSRAIVDTIGQLASKIASPT